MFCGCSCDPNSILIPEMLIEFVLFVFLFFLFFFFFLFWIYVRLRLYFPTRM